MEAASDVDRPCCAPGNEVRALKWGDSKLHYDRVPAAT
jgi:hypothetical protein